jgi:hypothetical protein
MCQQVATPPSWAVGNSVTAAPAIEADLLFSCPPYGDLERYSDHPDDLSTLAYPAFIARYGDAIRLACGRLKENRFAVWVVGDFRDRSTGLLRGFVGDTTDAFRAFGLDLYNDAVLVTARGSLPIRTSFYFRHGRKLGRMHQSVLVFVKGDVTEAERAAMGQEAAA